MAGAADRSNSAPKLAPLAPENTRASRVYDTLLDAIVHGRLAPNSLHSVTALAEALDVSRTPVREALLQLAARGMVRFERNVGVRVLRTTANDIEEIFELRLLLEAPTAAKAAVEQSPADLRHVRQAYERMLQAAETNNEPALWRYDRAFHIAMLEGAGNRRLAQFVDSLRDMVLVQGVTTAGRSRSLIDIAEEHREILEALEARNPEATARAVTEHLEHTRDLLLAQEVAIRLEIEQPIDDRGGLVRP
jgi:DNA-binding GntR family transcriptional regulator